MSAAPTTAVQTQTSATTAVAVEEPQPTEDPGDEILGHVLAELEKAGHKMLASTLESGSVALQGNELVVTISQPASVIDLMMSAEPKRLANAAGSTAMGRRNQSKRGQRGACCSEWSTAIARPRNGASARSRAAEDPDGAAHAGEIWRRDSHGDRPSREELGEAMGGFNHANFKRCWSMRRSRPRTCSTR